MQVKSAATNEELFSYANSFDNGVFRQLPFVVRSPKGDLALFPARDDVEVVGPARLAQLVIDLGLVPWLQPKLR